MSLAPAADRCDGGPMINHRTKGEKMSNRFGRIIPAHEPEVRIANLLVEFRRSAILIRNGGATEDQCRVVANVNFGPTSHGPLGVEVHEKMRKIVADVYNPGAVKTRTRMTTLTPPHTII
jgi:hypothetical protein